MATATKALATEDGQNAQTTQLQAISTAIGNIGLNNIGNLATLTTADKTSLVGAVNEVNAGLATKADETEVAAIENVYGSKNLLPNNAVTQTINGVTFTVNADKSITINGTATARTALPIVSISDGFKLPQGFYKMDNIPNGIAGINLVMQSGTYIGTFNQSNPVIEVNSTYANTICRVEMVITQNTTISNLTFYPMIRDARISDATYVPYAMTNRELTETIKDIRTGGITFSLSNESYKLVPVTFSKPMKNDQYVVFSNAEGGNSTYRFFISATNKSASGFSLYIVTDDTTQITTPTRAVGWVAIAL